MYSVFHGTGDDFGVDLEGPISSIQTDNDVQVPETSVLNQLQMEWLQTVIDVTTNDNNVGITIYMRTVETVVQML